MHPPTAYTLSFSATQASARWPSPDVATIDQLEIAAGEVSALYKMNGSDFKFLDHINSKIRQEAGGNPLTTESKGLCTLVSNDLFERMMSMFELLRTRNPQPVGSKSLAPCRLVVQTEFLCLERQQAVATMLLSDNMSGHSCAGLVDNVSCRWLSLGLCVVACHLCGMYSRLWFQHPPWCRAQHRAR